MTLHEAMRLVLAGKGWMDRDELAREISARDLYRRRDGNPPPSDQLRLRARRYPDDFECSDAGCSRIRLRPPRMDDLDFDAVLGLLLEWQGSTVAVGVDVTDRTLEVAKMRGTLGVPKDIADPFDEDEFEFAITELTGTGFALHRHYVIGANYFPDSKHLIIALTSRVANEDDSVTTFVHVVRHEPPDD